MEKIKEYINDKSKRYQHLVILLTMILTLLMAILLTGGRKEKVIHATKEWAETKASEFIDSHNYRAIPWDILMTQEDKSSLIKDEIGKLPELDLKEQNILDTITNFEFIAEETTKLLTDTGLYSQTIDDKSALEKPLGELYGNQSIYKLYEELLESIYSNPYNYPEEVYLISLKQSISSEGNKYWFVDFEFRTIKDSKDYTVFPVSLKFDNDFKFLDGSIAKPFESSAGTRPLTKDALIPEDSHEPFLVRYNEFSKLFNKDIQSGKVDDIHLKTMATDDIPLELLVEMHEASRGDLSNASITSWEMNDRKAEAISNYRLDIPRNSKGDTLSIKIVYSRPYDEILTINIIN